MIFPFSLWGGDPFQGIIQTLILNEDFATWFAGWNGIVRNLQLTETFTGFYNAQWNAVTQNLQLFDNFNSGW